MAPGRALQLAVVAWAGCVAAWDGTATGQYGAHRSHAQAWAGLCAQPSQRPELESRLRGGAICDEYEHERAAKEQRALARDLRRAADQGDLPALRRALALGAAVDCVDCSGFTALHLAAEKGHAEVVEALLQQVRSRH